MRRGGRFLLILSLLVSFSGASAPAQEKQEQPGDMAWSNVDLGVRIGASVNPDQFVMGGQAVIGEVLNPLSLAPSVDLGFGGGYSTFLINVDLRLPPLQLPKSYTEVYASVGPVLAFLNPDNGGTDTEVGISLNLGMQFLMGEDNRYNLEGRIGIGDIPDARILLGVLF